MTAPDAPRTRHWPKWGPGLLLASLPIVLAACIGGGAPSRDDVVEQLDRNAEEFEYTVGKQGGSLTFATISEPLTFNLAISTDASSSDVLGYLFEGLTQTSWLTNEVEPALAESWESSEEA